MRVVKYCKDGKFTATGAFALHMQSGKFGLFKTKRFEDNLKLACDQVLRKEQYYLDLSPEKQEKTLAEATSKTMQLLSDPNTVGKFEIRAGKTLICTVPVPFAILWLLNQFVNFSQSLPGWANDFYKIIGIGVALLLGGGGFQTLKEGSKQLASKLTENTLNTSLRFQITQSGATLSMLKDVYYPGCCKDTKKYFKIGLDEGSLILSTAGIDEGNSIVEKNVLVKGLLNTNNVLAYEPYRNAIYSIALENGKIIDTTHRYEFKKNDLQEMVFDKYPEAFPRNFISSS